MVDGRLGLGGSLMGDSLSNAWGAGLLDDFLLARAEWRLIRMGLAVGCLRRRDLVRRPPPRGIAAGGDLQARRFVPVPWRRIGG